MDWSVVVYWTNTILLGVLGIVVLITRRWHNLKWFPYYALLTSILSVVYLKWFYTHPFYKMKYIVGGLLLLAAVIEALRKETGREPWWSWFALMGLVIIPFLPISLDDSYFYPQVILNIGLASALPIALKKKSAPLLAWSVMGAASVASDFIKLVIPEGEVWQILRFLDPLWYTALLGIMLTGLFWEEIASVTVAIVSKLPFKWQLPRMVPAESPAGVNGHHAMVSTAPNVYNFPAVIPSSPGNSIHPPGDPSTREVLTEICTRMDALELALETASLMAIKTRKTFLSPDDLTVYLGISADDARRFVEKFEIPKINLTDDEDVWVVFRTDVDAALGFDEKDED